MYYSLSLNREIDFLKLLDYNQDGIDPLSKLCILPIFIENYNKSGGMESIFECSIG